MNKLLYSCIIMVGIALMGCPYEATVELNTYEESLKFDKKLLDEWVSFDEAGGREELVLEKGEKSVLFVSHRQFAKNNKLTSLNKYRAYSTEIGGYDIFNLETKDGKYLFTRYGWTSKNEFYIQFINGKYMEKHFVEETVTTENLRAFISEHVNKEELYDQKIEFYRKYSPEYEKVRMFMKKSGF